MNKAILLTTCLILCATSQICFANPGDLPEIMQASAYSVERLFHEPDSHEGQSAWSPDGTRIVFGYDGDIGMLAGTSVREKTLDADVNNDGIVNFLDLGVLTSQWLMT